MQTPAAIAVGAHPDDIEFCMAGTLLLLKQAGYDIHYFNLASGNCGSTVTNSRQTSVRRAKEAKAAAAVLGAHFHPSITNDLEIVYGVPLLRRLAAIFREVRPSIVLTHSPQDYMEDHMTTCRLVVTAAFARSMPNFRSSPERQAFDADTTVYHAMPHGLRDGLRRRVIPGAYVNTTLPHPIKVEALGQHKSQQKWLEVSQGLNSYLQTMHEMSLTLGRMSGRFRHAEGWRRHSHLGFSSEEAEPLREALGKNYLINPSYERALQAGA